MQREVLTLSNKKEACLCLLIRGGIWQGRGDTVISMKKVEELDNE